MTGMYRKRHSVRTTNGNTFGSAHARHATTRTRCRGRHRSRRLRGVHRPSKTAVASAVVSGEAAVGAEVPLVEEEEEGLVLGVLVLVPVVVPAAG